jgi:DNA-directed RNA polymerase specialized sigma subunit
MTAQPLATADDLIHLRQRYLDAIDAVQDACESTIDALVATREARRLTRENVRAGRPMTVLEHVLEPHSLRALISDSLGELERTRHDAQRLLFQLLHGEGQTMADIGRMWGISRQLVSRLVNEPDPTPLT